MTAGVLDAAEAGRSFGETTICAALDGWREKLLADHRLVADYWTALLFLQVKALPIEAAPAESLGMPAGQFAYWRAAAKGAYLDAAEAMLLQVLTDMKKQARVGKRFFTKAVRHMPMACPVMIFPNDPPGAPAGYLADLRTCLDDLSEFCGRPVRSRDG